MTGPAGGRRALTIVEVLVAIAIFALLSAALSSVWLSALRMTAAAEAASERERALEPFTLPAALVASPPPACPAAEDDAAAVGDEDASPCLVRTERCVAGLLEVTCGAGGDLARFDLRIPGLPPRPGAQRGEAERLSIWARVPP